MNTMLREKETGIQGKQDKAENEFQSSQTGRLSGGKNTTPNPSPITIRPYRIEDYPAVFALWQEAKLRPYLEHEIERLLNSGGGALVAVTTPCERSANAHADETETLADSQVVGVILWSHNGSVGILWRLAVAEHQRGQGIATKLLDRAELDIRNTGLSGVTLLTRVTNTVAKSMYSKRGYKHSDHLEFWGKKLPE